ADEPVEDRHRAPGGGVEAAAEHEIGATVDDGRDERRDLLEVVGEVGVGHDHDVAPRRVEPRAQRPSVAAPPLGDDTRARLLGHVGRAVGGPVVDDDDLSRDACAAHRVERFLDAEADGVGLVEARQHDRDERRHPTRRLTGRCAATRACYCPSMPVWRRWPFWLALVTFAGLAIRVVYVLGWKHPVPVAGDAFYYHHGANLLVDGKG